MINKEALLEEWEDLKSSPTVIMLFLIGICLGFGGVGSLYSTHPTGQDLVIGMVVILFGIACILATTPVLQIEKMHKHFTRLQLVPKP